MINSRSDVDDTAGQVDVEANNDNDNDGFQDDIEDNDDSDQDGDEDLLVFCHCLSLDQPQPLKWTSTSHL